MRCVPAVIHGALSQINRYLGLMLVTNGSADLASLLIVVPALVLLLLLGAGGVALVVLIVLIGIFPSPTTAGAQFVAHETANRNPVFWRDQIDGIRSYGLIALRCWLVSSIIGGVLALNAVFYFRHHFPLAGVFGTVFLIALVWWCLCHLYVYPLIMEQQDKRLLLIYRNAILIVLARPGFTVIVGAIWLTVLIALSFTALVALFGLILCAQIQQNAAAVILPTLPSSSTSQS